MKVVAPPVPAPPLAVSRDIPPPADRAQNAPGSLEKTRADRQTGDTATLGPAAQGSRALAPYKPAPPPEPVDGSGRTFIDHPLARILDGVSARAMTPRQVQAMSLDLYANGILTWDEHAELSFQPELHPDFARTIGALTGEVPLPDQPRDFVREWEDRLAYAERHNPIDSPERERALHILSVLRRIDSPTDVSA
ncbi:MAG: hypothetical protein HQL35_07200 [Alphaproteobacteria bacterium]|nr:hypothetical protein [Alphaproteobacteria bacterium]